MLIEAPYICFADARCQQKFIMFGIITSYLSRIAPSRAGDTSSCRPLVASSSRGNEAVSVLLLLFVRQGLYGCYYRRYRSRLAAVIKRVHTQPPTSGELTSAPAMMSDRAHPRWPALHAQ